MTGVRNALNVVSVTGTVPLARIRRGRPTGIAFPYIRMHAQNDSEDIGTLTRRVYQIFYITVIAVSKDEDEAGSISALVDAVLERGSLTIANGTHGYTRRDGEVMPYDEDSEDGETFYHNGGIYEIGVKPT